LNLRWVCQGSFFHGATLAKKPNLAPRLAGRVKAPVSPVPGSLAEGYPS
jgi:hypothetical protein